MSAPPEVNGLEIAPEECVRSAVFQRRRGRPCSALPVVCNFAFFYLFSINMYSPTLLDDEKNVENLGVRPDMR